LGRLRFGLTQSRELQRLDIVDLTAHEVGTLQEFVSLPDGGIPPQNVPRDQADKRSRRCHGGESSLAETPLVNLGGKSASGTSGRFRGSLHPSFSWLACDGRAATCFLA
jgi:hypothetical protein